MSCVQPNSLFKNITVGHLQIASHLEQVANLWCARVNSAS